jgi:hypothetical protein
MTEARLEGGEARADSRSARTGRLRRLLLLLAVTLLCGAAYLTGVWYGMQGGMTCSVTGPGLIECRAGGDAPSPAEPEAPPRESGSA